MKVYWTDRAKARLKELESYIAQDSESSAKKVVKRLLIKSNQISVLPYSGRKVPEYGQDDIREMLVKPYRIIYRIRTDRIDVLTVMHYRQLLPSDTKRL
jgi:addiction module RelE/StbE family toxin